jgi:hypothetical protein
VAIASGAQFEVKVSGEVRTHRDERDTAVEAARFLQQRPPGAKILITDLRTTRRCHFERDSEHRDPVVLLRADERR